MNMTQINPEMREPGAPPPQAPPAQTAGYGSHPADWNRSNYYPDEGRHKLPALAALFSIMPGLGQVYIGYYRQGFINVLVVASLITLLNTRMEGVHPLAGIFLAFFWLYNMVDAARKATLYNQALAGQGPAALPEEGRILRGRESLVGGAILILIGFVLFLHTRFGISLDWVERWWPIGLVLMGAYLVVMNYFDRKKDEAGK